MKGILWQLLYLSEGFLFVTLPNNSLPTWLWDSAQRGVRSTNESAWNISLCVHSKQDFCRSEMGGMNFRDSWWTGVRFFCLDMHKFQVMDAPSCLSEQLHQNNIRIRNIGKLIDSYVVDKANIWQFWCSSYVMINPRKNLHDFTEERKTHDTKDVFPSQ